MGENRPVPKGLRPGIRAAALLPLPIVRTMGLRVAPCRAPSGCATRFAYGDIRGSPPSLWGKAAPIFDARLAVARGG
jgi:hypothetical protein